MKNVSCFQLSIDRSKAPKKMGTFKDISLFGNFLFPMEGQYAAGVIARSLAGTGKVSKKTKEHLRKISSRCSPLAGSTGASVSSELPQGSEEQLHSTSCQGDVYSIRFINHAPEPIQWPSLLETDRILTPWLPSKGFGLKKNSGKRVVFSLAQKEIMISFYNRQASSGVRADPKAVIACMRERGLEVLKETQIRSWWSTYHQKRKRSVSVLHEDAAHLQGLHPSQHSVSQQQPVTMSQQQPIPVTQASAPATQSQQQPIPATQVSSTVTQSQQHPFPVTQVSSPVTITQQQPIPVTQVSSPVTISQHQPIPVTQVPAPVTVSQRQPVPLMQASAPVMVSRQQSTPVFTPVTVSQQQPITNVSAPATQGMGGNAMVGESITGLTHVLQWSFPSDFCQSSIAGRCGSNACTFIALYFGYLYLQDNLPPPNGNVLPMEWKHALYKAMKRGNEIHDELFEGEGVDVSVEDAVSMAGMECFVSSIDQSIDVFGQDCEDQLASVFHTLATTLQSRCNAVVTTGRTLLFIINQDGSCMIVDSHKHQNKGALIAYCPSSSAKLLAKWLTTMLQETWQCTLRVCSVIPIYYITS